MASIFSTETRRSIRDSLGRFLAIMGITALGCGFFAGLRMTGADMRADADAWYDGTHLYDIRVISTLGLADEDVEELGQVEGVEAAMGSVTLDVMARMGGEQYAVRVGSLPVEAAQQATAVSDWQVASDDEGYLNRVRLLSGSWPTAEGECVLEGDKALPGVSVGDQIEVLFGTRDVDDVLATRTLTVVGLVSSSAYPYTGTFGSTTLGSGTIGAYVYVGPETLAEGCPYTEAYLTVEGARDEESESDAYYDLVRAVEARIEDEADDLSAARLVRLRTSSQAQIDEGREQLAEQSAQAQASLDALAGRVSTLEASVADLEAQRSEAAADPALASRADDLAEHLATMQESLERARESYDTAKEQAATQIADAQAQLDDAQAEVDSLTQGQLYVLDRSQNEGLVTYRADTERMDAIAEVFPTMFFLVAALVSLTTMTRMVEGERQVIGTHKALGYGKARIASRYLAYAAVASLVGAVVGIAVLTQVLPYIIISSYAIIYAVPIAGFPLPVAPAVGLGAAGLGVGVTLAATLAAVLASLAEAPARLMLPLAPKPGKRILLERVRPLWRHLSFSWKLTCRNLFRYKRRLLMTVVGVAGCTGLLLVGFGLHDAIWDIIDNQFGPILHYDTTVGLSSDATEADIQAAVGYLESSGSATDLVRVESDNMRAGADGFDETGLLVSVVVPADDASLTDAVTFRDRLSGASVPFDADAVLVTEKLSQRLGIGVGDDVVVYDQDEVGNAVGDGYRLRVTGVVENYVGNYVYVGNDAWAAATGRTPAYGTVYATTDASADAQAILSEHLEGMEHVATVVFSSTTIDTYRQMLVVVDLVVVVLVVCAAALAAVVLYNLTNINVSERVREIATLKVLGFLPREVHAYVFREVLILAVLGDAVGMLFGTWLETFVVTTAEVDYVMFGRTIHPLSYALSFAITLAFAVLVVLSMRRRLDDVDMVESLKSVD